MVELCGRPLSSIKRLLCSCFNRIRIKINLRDECVREVARVQAVATIVREMVSCIFTSGLPLAKVGLCSSSSSSLILSSFTRVWDLLPVAVKPLAIGTSPASAATAAAAAAVPRGR